MVQGAAACALSFASKKCSELEAPGVVLCHQVWSEKGLDRNSDPATLQTFPALFPLSKSWDNTLYSKTSVEFRVNGYEVPEEHRI